MTIANLTVPLRTDQDYFASEGLAENNTDTSLVLTTRQRLIVMLYALVFEHARQCDVWYCLLQVPPSLLSLLQTYFRVTPVPRQATTAEHQTPSSSLMIPVLCDLQKCSIKYALLLMRENLSPRRLPKPYPGRSENDGWSVCRRLAKSKLRWR